MRVGYFIAVNAISIVTAIAMGCTTSESIAVMTLHPFSHADCPGFRLVLSGAPIFVRNCATGLSIAITVLSLYCNAPHSLRLQLEWLASFVFSNAHKSLLPDQCTSRYGGGRSFVLITPAF